MVQLLAEHLTTEHKLNATAALLDPVRRDRALQLLAELARGAVMADYFSLADFLRLNPGAGALFEPVDRDSRDRKQAFEAAARQRDPVRAIGPSPTVAQQALLNAYGVTLSQRVLPAAHEEISVLADELEAELGVDVHVSARAKKPAALLDKIRRMTSGRPGRPSRPDYRLGDVVDAVGVRLTVPDMRSLEAALRKTIERFGTGDGGRILEMENMYAAPKPHAPAYRVIPLIVSLEVDGMPYPYELQLTTERASIAADIEHNTIYKPYVQLDAAQEQLVRDAMAEAAALDQLETVERNADE